MDELKEAGGWNTPPYLTRRALALIPLVVVDKVTHRLTELYAPKQFQRLRALLDSTFLVREGNRRSLLFGKYRRYEN